MKILILGVGYVGLVTGACLSDFGHEVVCVDKNVKKIDDLEKGILPIFEPGLDVLIKRNVEARRLSFRHDLKKEVFNSDVIFIAVGTPTSVESQEADLSSLFEAIDEISSILAEDQIVVIKSTVTVGTNDRLFEYLKSKEKKIFSVVSNPEFLREGSAIEDFMKPDRVIIGVRNDISERIMREVYKPLYLRDFPIVFTDPNSAELTKYASNAFLATKISFINEISLLCEKVGADVKEIAKGMGLDGRIGGKFLRAGPGYGGSCFPKDTLAFTSLGRKFSAPQSIVEAVIIANENTKKRMISKIENVFESNILRIPNQPTIMHNIATFFFK